MKSIALLLAGACAALSHGLTFTGAGFDIPDSQNTPGHIRAGQASSEVVLSGTGITLASLNSVTLTGLRHARAGDLVVGFSVNEGAVAYLSLFLDSRLGLQPGFDGTYTFRPLGGPETRINEAFAGLGPNDVLPSGSYGVSGTGNSAGTSFDPFKGLSLDGNWRLNILDFTNGETGSLESWSMDVTPQAVPEPATMAALGLGAAATLRKRRR